MVLAVVAKEPLAGGCPTLPAPGVRDVHDLLVGMVCPGRPA